MALATLGVVAPGIAAIYEFLVKGRKRLGYRVQMDTTANDVGDIAAPGALGELSNNGVPLVDPSIVLLRIENTGRTNIDEHDYAVRDDDKAGIRVSFPGRRTMALIAFLAVLVVAQSVVFFRSDNGTPLDCASGRLTLTGSTAFEPVAREAAQSYQDVCTEATFSFEMRGSGEGLLALARARRER
uniref:hypothetical protein n=1 Tax=Paractinoplanes polyasparticus TaxID=2856853 RepID=UPI001C864EF4|nr:hypothetical protein [Actinoplanes polyasparticus]